MSTVAEGSAPPGDRSLLAGLGAALLGPLVLLGWMVQRGLDRTDEGLYLNLAAHPVDDRSQLFQFGRVYHPMFLVAGGDVVAYRALGAVLTMLVCAALAWVVLGTEQLRPPGTDTPRPVLRATGALSLGAAGLLGYVSAPSTPSYNSLALQCCALVATGLVLAATRPSRPAAAGWFAVGAGGWAALLAKPTTAAALAAVVLVAVVVVPGSWRRRLPWAFLGLAAALAATTVGYGRSPLDLVAVLRRGYAVMSTLGGHTDLVRLDPLTIAPLVLTTTAALGVAVLGLAVLAARSAALPVAVVVGVVAVVLPVLLHASWRLTSTPSSAGPQAMVVLAAAALVAAVVTVLGPVRADRTTAGLSLVLLVLPFAYSFGTNLNLWTATSRACLFWLVLVAARLVGHRRVPWAVPGLLVTALLVPMLATTVVAPYRYPTLLRADTPAPVGDRGTVLLGATDARQARDLRALARRVGIGPDTRVLDLTGDSPGYVFQMGARPATLAWVIGGYAGSAPALETSLRADPCGLVGAYLLVDPTGPRRLPPEVLRAVGLDMERDYRQVGTFDRLRPKWGATPRTFRAATELWAPRSGSAVPGC